MADYNNKNGRRRGGDERPRGDKPYGKKPYGEKAYGEKNYGERPYGERRFGDKPRGGKPFEKKPNGDRPFGDKQFGDRGFGDRKFGDRPFEKKPYGEKSFEKKPYGDKPFDRKPYGERSFEKKPNGDKPFGDKRFADRGFGDRKFGDRPFGKKPYGEKPFGDRPFDKKPYGEKPYGDRSFNKKRFDAPGAGEKPYQRRFDDRPAPRPFGDVREEQKPEELPNIIMGRNPVKEAIKSGKSIDRILVTKEHDGSLGEIIGLARDRDIIIRETDRRRLDELCMPFGHDGKPGNHQGIVAEIPGVEYSELSDILAYAEEKGEKPFVILLDGVEDPHNLGSVIRSAECAGAHGVIIPKRRSAPVTAAVVKTSAGAAEHMRIARVVNIVAAMEQLKEAGLWIAGADMAGESMYKTDMKGAFALVIGGEGEGLSKLVREKCDFLVSIPLRGSIDSLNAAVAATIIMFEKNRQDGEN